MKYKIPFIKPHLPDADDLIEDFREIRENNWFTNFGPFEAKLCRSISAIYNDKAQVTTVANATLGLQSAVDLLLINKKNKPEVLVPSFTFAAGPEVLIKMGLRPVLIDIEEDTWQPSIKQATEYLKNNLNHVGGILLCNSFGVGNIKIEEWEHLASEHDIPLIIDSAAGFGSLYQKNEKIGLRGDCEIFSMHATKPFSVGEGGLVISKNADFIKNIRSYQNFGFNESRDINIVGTNAKLQELNCAIGLRQLVNFEQRLIQRRQVLVKYKQQLAPVGFKFMQNDDLSTVCFASTLAPTNETASAIRQELIEKGVEVGRYYSPLHMQKIILDHSKLAGGMETTEGVYSRVLSLPVHDNMSDEDIEYITNTIIHKVGR